MNLHVQLHIPPSHQTTPFLNEHPISI